MTDTLFNFSRHDDTVPEVTVLADDFSESAKWEAIDFAESSAIEADLASWKVGA